LIKIYNQQLQLVAILENAYDVSVEKRVNELWVSSFSLPIDDPKNTECKHFNFVEIVGDSGRNYGKYRISPIHTKKHDNHITYSCEHVLSTLLDDVMEGFNQYSNVTTAEVLISILNMQGVKHWVLGDVDFDRYFEYGFSNENGLLAPILSIPKPFNEPYEFTYNTDVYPFVLNLKAVSDEVKAEFCWGKDMISFDEVADPAGIVNYIIPKGYGEGVNQLTIESVNGGLNYLKDQTSIDQWGKRSYIWIDKRFESAETLKANGQSLLDQWKEPRFSFTCKATDLSILPEYAHEQKILNGVTRIIVEEKTYQGRIISEKISDLSQEHDVDYEIGNKLDDIATTQADLVRKQQINDAYSQGSVSQDTRTYADNADQDFPAIIEFPIDENCININKAVLRYKVDKFRGYTRGMASAGQVVQSVTSSAGGSVVQSVTSSSGGGTTVSSAAGGDHTHIMFNPVNEVPGSTPKAQFRAKAQAGTTLNLNLEAPFADIYTYGASGNHTHNLTLAPHTHSTSINIPSHTHATSINIPSHTHATEYGIWEASDSPSNVAIYVDGQLVTGVTSLDGEIDLVPYLSTDTNGNINRDYHIVSIVPNDICRVVANVSIQQFIQSRGNYNK
jgi:phage minor structural protein